MLLAQGLARRPGEDAIEVRVVTRTAARGSDDRQFPFTVVRRPSVATLAQLIWWADIVHVAGPCFLPMLLGLMLRKRVVVEHHGYQAICPSGLLLHRQTASACPGHFMAGRYGECLGCNAHEEGWVKSTAMMLRTFPRRWLCAAVTRNVPITRHVERRLQLPKSQVIYYGIEDQAPLNSATALDKPLCFAFVGRLVEEKGVAVLLNATGRLKQRGHAMRLRIVGDGPERASLENLTTQLGIQEQVTFTGFLRGEALAHALEDAVAVVMPTLMEETAGLAVIEQMMRGRVVIVSDIGGLSEVVGDAGLKFAPGNAESLSACLRQVIEDPALVRTLSERARQRAAHWFTVDRMVTEHVALYRDLLMQAPPPVAYETFS
jgi:glycosyltransferase involved in cell wall biosynthesis